MSRPRIEDIEVPASADDGDVPTVDSGILVYAPPAGGASVLDDLTDVDTTSTPPSDGDRLGYDDGTSMWIPVAPTDGLPTGGTDGQVLTKLSSTDGDADWETPSGGSAPVNIDDPTTFDTAYGSGTGASYEMNGHGTSIPAGLTGTGLGTSTFVQDNGALAMAVPSAAGDNVRMVGAAVTGSTWVAVMKMTAAVPRPSVANYGMYLRDSTSGKIMTLARQQSDTRLYVFKWNSPTSFNATSTFIAWGLDNQTYPLYWRIRKNSSTSYDFAVSHDGVIWRTVSAALDVSAFLTAPNEVGFHDNSTSAVDSVACHWLRWR